LCEYKDKTSDD